MPLAQRRTKSFRDWTKKRSVLSTKYSPSWYISSVTVLRPESAQPSPRSSLSEGANKLINALAGPECRVLVTGGEAREPSVEVAHEKLFTAWPQLSEWIDKGGDALGLIDHVSEAARRWHEGGENPQEIWLASRATEAVNALLRFGKQASPVLASFLRPQEVLIKQLEQDSLAHDRRALIGRLLAEFGDPRPGVGLRLDGLPHIEWVDIERGKVKLEEVEKGFDVKRFRIAKYPVTNLQFQAFINADDGYRNQEWWKGIKQSEAPADPSWKEANSPRETVSWFEAVAFCRWLSKRTGSTHSLTDRMGVATGSDGGRSKARISVARRAGTRRSVIATKAGSTARPPSGYIRAAPRCRVCSIWPEMSGSGALTSMKNQGVLSRLRIDDDERGQRVMRGGSWYNLPVFLRASIRDWYGADYRFNFIGFRLAQDLE